MTMIIRSGQKIVVRTSGIRGAQGLSGSGVVSFVHTQVVPSVTWIINHGIGYNPNVTLVDSSGAKFEPDAIAYSLGTVVVTMNAATAGVAYLS